MPRSVIDSGQVSLHTTNPTSNDDFSSGYDYGSEWLNTLTGTFWKCYDPTEGAAKWFDSRKAENTANDSNFTLYNPGPLDPYIEIGETTYKVFASFIFRGTGTWTPTSMILVSSRSKSKGTSYLRLYDYTHGAQVVAYAFSEQAITIHVVPIVSTNLPIGQAVFEIQACRDSSNSGTAQIRAVGLYP